MTSLLFDSMSLLFRGYHGLPPMHTSRGEPTSAIYGVCQLLLKLLREQRPDGIAFAFEGGRTHRHDAFADYKAGRRPLPEELVHQMGRLRELVTATGAPGISVPGYEADDVLASLTRVVDGDVVVVTGDRDLLQTVDDTTTVLFLGQRGGPYVHYDVPAVVARFGLRPDQLPSYVALVGDSSDNLPKVPGVGAKTATRLVADHGDVAGIYAHIDDLRSGKLRDALVAHETQVRANERLARLVADLPLAPPHTAAIDDAACDRLDALFVELELESLRPRLAALRDHSAT